MQRCKLVMDQITEARDSMLKVLDHKERVMKLLNKNSSTKKLNKLKRKDRAWDTRTGTGFSMSTEPPAPWPLACRHTALAHSVSSRRDSPRVLIWWQDVFIWQALPLPAHTEALGNDNVKLTTTCISNCIFTKKFFLNKTTRSRRGHFREVVGCWRFHFKVVYKQISVKAMLCVYRLYSPLFHLGALNDDLVLTFVCTVLNTRWQYFVMAVLHTKRFPFCIVALETIRIEKP